MSRRLLVVLIVLGVLATGGGVAGGLLLARDPGGDPAVAGPTTIPETTVTPTSEPISAVLVWGFGGPSGHQLQFPGPAAQGSIKLVLARTTRSVSMRVTGQSADGRTGTSDTLSARRLVRQVVLEVQALTLDIPNGTGGIATAFRGTTFTPLGPGLGGPRVSAGPCAFPSSVLGAGLRSGPLALRFFHEVQPNPTRTRVVNLTIPFPRSGQSTLNRNVSAVGLTAHLRLRVTVTVS